MGGVCAGPSAHPVRYWEPSAARAEGSARRIRLVAYGARLESVLGASPRGFESPILRHFLLSAIAPRSQWLRGSSALQGSFSHRCTHAVPTLCPHFSDGLRHL